MKTTLPVAVFGLSVADLVRYTELGPDVILDILGAGFKPFSASQGAE